MVLSALAIFLAGWVYVTTQNVAVVDRFNSGVWDGGDLLVLGLLIAWLVVGANAICGLIREFFSGERIEVAKGILSIRRKRCTFGRTATYEVARVRSLRVRAEADGAHLQGWAFRRVIGRITFEYDGSKVDFGEALDEEDATEVWLALRARGLN